MNLARADECRLLYFFKFKIENCYVMFIQRAGVLYRGIKPRDEAENDPRVY